MVLNELPNIDNVVEKLRWLIENPNEISKISRNARKFIETYHKDTISAEIYLKLWKHC